MIIKVCGMRNADNIRAIDAVEGVDWMGFIFFGKSSRNVTEVPSYLPVHCQRVGVFVNAEAEDIAQRAEEFRLNLVQLHGHETPDDCQAIRSVLGNEVKIIKMIQISTVEDIEATRPYEGVTDYFLFETKCDSYGGSGQQFDWDILQHYHGRTPFLITGGIGAEGAEKVKAFRHPRFVGIDLNSRFETAPALKDVEKVKAFVKLAAGYHPTEDRSRKVEKSRSREIVIIQ